MKDSLLTKFTFQEQNESRIPCDVTRDSNEYVLTFGLFG